MKNTSPRLRMDVLPENAFLCIVEEHFKDDAWRPLIDVVAEHGMYNFLTVTMRLKGRPITDPETKALFRRLVDDAAARGLTTALDLDPRLARAEFLRRHPDEAQRIVYLHEMPVRGAEEAFEIKPESFGDHMTFNGTPYRSLQGRFIRALACRCDEQNEVIPDSVTDLSAGVIIETASGAGVKGRCTGLDPSRADRILVLVEFELFTPDVFSPHLIAYQRELLELYADLPLRGAVKDEWGFPPTSTRIIQHRAFWYSSGYEDAYRKASNGRSLLDDLPLMALAFRGRAAERARAINRFMFLNLQRQRTIEEAYYRDVKAIFGEQAYVTKHATWYPRINDREIFKNGLSWWAARRDIAQSDEITPLSACTAMSKKFGSPVWMNEGYSSHTKDYRRNIWRYALAGGRMVYHPLYPCPLLDRYDPLRQQVLKHGLLLTPDLIRAECRVRLLNFISRSPLDCPVALVFGHASVMNWAEPGYLDYGEALSLRLWQNGYAVDLYPSTEIEAGTFTIDADGAVRVGQQRYRALILYRPDMCPTAVADFFRRRPITRTALYRAGTWTRDAEANPFDGVAALGDGFRELPEGDAGLGLLMEDLNRAGAVRQPPLVEPYLLFGNTQIGMPAPNGTARLIDGTVIRISAMRESDAGDDINETLDVNGVRLVVRATGLVAARVDAKGQLDAWAAGGLSRLQAPGVDIRLDTPLDLALWREGGSWRGVVQGLAGDTLPDELLALTSDWEYLSIPSPFIPEAQDEPVPAV